MSSIYDQIGGRLTPTEYALLKKTYETEKKLHQLSGNERFARIAAKVVVLTAALFTGGLLGAAIGAPIGGVGGLVGAALGAAIAFTVALTALEKMDAYIDQRAVTRNLAILEAQVVRTE